MTFALPHTKPVFKHQPDATINQDNPDSGTKYEWSSDGTQAKKLGTQKNVKIISIDVQCTWTVQPTPLEVHVTIDGKNIKHSADSPLSAKWYEAYPQAYNAENNQPLSDVETVQYSLYRPFLYEGRNVKVEAEVTGGTVSNLSARVKWAKME